MTFKEEAVKTYFRMANRPSSTTVNRDVATVPCCCHDVRCREFCGSLVCREGDHRAHCRRSTHASRALPPLFFQQLCDVSAGWQRWIEHDHIRPGAGERARGGARPAGPCR